MRELPLTAPSSQRRDVAQKNRQINRIAKAAGMSGDELQSRMAAPQQQAPQQGEEAIMSPLGRAHSALSDAKQAVKAKGADRAGMITAVAAKIHEKLAGLPPEAAQPLSDEEIEKLAEQAIQSILAQQKQQSLNTVMAAVQKIGASNTWRWAIAEAIVGQPKGQILKLANQERERQRTAGALAQQRRRRRIAMVAQLRQLANPLALANNTTLEATYPDFVRAAASAALRQLR